MKDSNNYAIANRTTILYKLRFGSICETITEDTYAVNYYFASGYNVTEIGVYYYTTNVASKTRIPVTEATYNDGTYCNINTRIDKNDIITSKVRLTPTYPIFFLITNVNPSTIYHIGGYCKLSDNSYYEWNEVTVTTRGDVTNNIIFNPVTTDVTSEHQEEADKYKAALDIAFPIVKAMFDDAADNISNTFTPKVIWTSQNYAAVGVNIFNCKFFSESEVYRSTIVHEMEHGTFDGRTSSGNFATDDIAIKFMEFATDCENAAWGQIAGHYYPIISSARYDYIDDYLVVMATDVDNLNFNS